MDIKMFDVFQVDFGNAIGSEQEKERPAVVVQNDKGNKYSPTVIVIPLTKELKKLSMPTHEIIHKNKLNGLSEDSMLVGEQMRAIDKSRILYKRGFLNQEKEKNSVMQVFLANATGRRGCSILWM